MKDAESDRDNFQLKYNDCLEKRSNIREHGQLLKDSHKEKQDIIEKLQQDYDHYTKKVGQYNNELTRCRKKEAEDEGEIRNLREKAENMINNPKKSGRA